MDVEDLSLEAAHDIGREKPEIAGQEDDVDVEFIQHPLRLRSQLRRVPVLRRDDANRYLSSFGPRGRARFPIHDQNRNPPERGLGAVIEQCLEVGAAPGRENGDPPEGEVAAIRRGALRYFELPVKTRKSILIGS